MTLAQYCNDAYDEGYDTRYDTGYDTGISTGAENELRCVVKNMLNKMPVEQIADILEKPLIQIQEIVDTL